MKSIIFSFIFLFWAQAFAEDNYRALQPLGAIPKGSQIETTAAKPKNGFFNPNKLDNSSPTGMQTVANDSVVYVNSIKSSSKSADMTTYQSLAKDNQLVASKSVFSAADQSCITKGTCTLTSDIPVYQASKFNFFDWLRDLFGMGEVKSLVTPTLDRTDPKAASAAVLSEKVAGTNRALTGQENSCTELPAELKNNPLFQCGLQQAREAHQNNKATGKVTSDTFIFNDFKNGELTGKMYFFNSEGQLAKVLERNPIPVARGVNGFGSGNGSKTTPNGAIVTKPFKIRSYSRNDGININDGIELLGLEGGNKDIHGRGVLLHGWSPYAETAGCLGVAGTISTDKAGVEELGGRPLYLDELKSGLLKQGGVMIYNFTPKKASLCK